MTVEELKNKLISEAQDGWNKLNITKRVCGSEFSYYDGYVDCGFIKEEQIQIDAEQIRALQKQNGELTDELKTLRESMKDYGAGCYENGLRNGRRKLEGELTLTNNECKDMREELKQRIRENQKLCEQIEKMKNCKNCNKLKKEKDGLLVCTVGSFYTNTFGENCDKWEIKENG